MANMNDVKRTKFNIILLGESRVGKTCLVTSLTKGAFMDTGLLTAGIDFHIVEKEFEGKKYKFKIFDTAGQERYKSISKSSIKLADGILLIFAVNNKNSFEKINSWIDSIKDEVNEFQKSIILCGNKIDVENREISYKEGLEFAETHRFKYFETSAKTLKGVQEVFEEMYKDIYDANKKMENTNIEITKSNNESKKKKSINWC